MNAKENEIQKEIPLMNTGSVYCNRSSILENRPWTNNSFMTGAYGCTLFSYISHFHIDCL